jgi:hypothetical protein
MLPEGQRQSVHILVDQLGSTMLYEGPQEQELQDEVSRLVRMRMLAVHYLHATKTLGLRHSNNINDAR